MCGEHRCVCEVLPGQIRRDGEGFVEPFLADQPKRVLHPFPLVTGDKERWSTPIINTQIMNDHILVLVMRMCVEGRVTVCVYGGLCVCVCVCVRLPSALSSLCCLSCIPGSGYSGYLLCFCWRGPCKLHRQQYSISHCHMHALQAHSVIHDQTFFVSTLMWWHCKSTESQVLNASCYHCLCC